MNWLDPRKIMKRLIYQFTSPVVFWLVVVQWHQRTDGEVVHKGESIHTEGSEHIETEDMGEDITDKWSVRSVLIALYAVIFVVGICGNGLVMHVVIWQRHMRTVTNIFIANLALSDIMMCLWCVPFTPVSGFLDQWVLGTFLCSFTPMILMVCVYVSTYTSTAIALDRFKVIIYPFDRKLKQRTAVWLTLLIWCSAFLLSLPMGIHHNLVQHTYEAEPGVVSPLEKLSGVENTSTTTFVTHGTQPARPTAHNLLAAKLSFDPSGAATVNASNGSSTINTQRPNLMVFDSCEETWSRKAGQAFTIISTALQYLIPGCIIAYCYTRIFVALSRKVTVKKRDETELRRKRRMNKMLVAMVVIFALCWLPMNVVLFLLDYVPEHVQSTWRFRFFAFYVSHVIAMSCTIYNPFLYGWLNDNFRKEFERIIPACLLARQPDRRESRTEGLLNGDGDDAGGGECGRRRKRSSLGERARETFRRGTDSTVFADGLNHEAEHKRPLTTVPEQQQAAAVSSQQEIITSCTNTQSGDDYVYKDGVCARTGDQNGNVPH